MADILNIRNEQGEWISVPAITGESAYDVAVRNGFKGTEQEWLESLKGEQGIQGPPGSGSETASKLSTARLIDGVSFDGTANVTHIGLASRGSSNSEIVVNIPGLTLSNGTKISVLFESFGGLEGGSYTLKVNNFDAIPIRVYDQDKWTYGNWNAPEQPRGRFDFVYEDNSFNKYWLVYSSPIAYEACKLKSKPNIRVNLGKTNKTALVGDADIEPGVTGVLPVANGGTSSNSAPSAIETLAMNLGIETTISSDDYIMFRDTSAAAGKRITFNNLKSAIGSTGSSGSSSVAETANKLATPRTLQTNLASTTAASFDGSANASIGVTGVLPVAKGGTGKSTAPEALYNMTLAGHTMSKDIEGEKWSTYKYLESDDYIMIGDKSETESGKINIIDFASQLSFLASTVTTISDSDYVNIRSDNTAKKITFANFKSAIGSTGSGSGSTVTYPLSISKGGTGKNNAEDALFSLITNCTTASGIDGGDYLVFLDSSMVAARKINFTTLKNAIGSSSGSSGGSTIDYPIAIENGGTGETTASDGFYALANGSSTTSSIADNDYIPFVDYSASTGKKITLSNLKSAIGSTSGGSGSNISTPVSIANGGTGGTTATVGVKNLIAGLTATASISTSDYIPFGNSSTSSKITLANLKTALGVSSGGSSSTTESHKIATGTYTGNGSDNGNYQKITIGFRPSFVFVCSLKANSPISIDGNSSVSYIYFGAAYDGVPSEQNSETLEINGLASTGGFTVSNSEYNASDGHVYQYLNHLGKTYAYFAVE